MKRILLGVLYALIMSTVIMSGLVTYGVATKNARLQTRNDSLQTYQLILVGKLTQYRVENNRLRKEAEQCKRTHWASWTN